MTALALSVLVPCAWSAGELSTRAAAAPAATRSSTQQVAHEARSSQAATRPRLGAISLSKTHLPGPGGKIGITASASQALRCRLSVKPALGSLPRSGTGCRDGSVTWHVHIPASQTAAPTAYHFTVTAIGAHHGTVSKHRTVKVAETTRPPRLSSLTASTQQLTSNGGPVTVTAATLRAKRCTLTVAPAILGLPRTTSCLKGAPHWTPTLPPNDVGTAATYSFTLTATGTHGQQAHHAFPVTVAPQSPTCPGQTSVDRPQTMAVFNDPSTGDPQHQTAIVDDMINLICDVSPPTNGTPSEINLAMFLYQLPTVSDALMWAHQYRGADVHVVLDGGNAFIDNGDGTNSPNPAYTALLNGADGFQQLPTGSVILCGADADQQPPPPDDGEEPTFTPAQTACAGENIMHNKMLLVSSIDTAGEPAVLTSSQNLSLNAEQAAFNDGMQIVGNRSIYAANHNYLTQLRTHQKQTDPDFGDEIGDTASPMAGATVTSMFFPRNDPPSTFPAGNDYNEASDIATDPVPKLLNRVKCQSDPGAFAGDHSGPVARTVVDIAMYTYGERDSITDALVNLASHGCEVNILYDSINSQPKATLLGTSNVTLKQLNNKNFAYTNGSGSGHVFVHDKYLLISGAVANSAGTTQVNHDIVQAGSQNYTQPALHYNDDQDLRVEQTATSATGSVLLFSGYQQDWSHLWQLGTLITPK